MKLLRVINITHSETENPMFNKQNPEISFDMKTIFYTIIAQKKCKKQTRPNIKSLNNEYDLE